MKKLHPLLVIIILSFVACDKEIIVEDHENYIGGFTDIRDGQVYPMIQIGSQVWLAENMRYQDTASKTPCYWPNKSIEVLEEKGGQFYSWEGAKKACPSGWKLPNQKDIQQLMKTTSTLDLLDARGWEMNKCKEDTYYFNESAFSALPTGMLKIKNNTDLPNCSMGRAVYLWMDMPQAFYVEMICDQVNEVLSPKEASVYMPCRCIKEVAIEKAP